MPRRRDTGQSLATLVITETPEKPANGENITVEHASLTEFDDIMQGNLRKIVTRPFQIIVHTSLSIRQEYSAHFGEYLHAIHTTNAVDSLQIFSQLRNPPRPIFAHHERDQTL